jgi:hypothetical protein
VAEKAVGFIETFGLTAAIAAADAAVKSANVKLLGYEYAKGDGMCTVKVEGDVGACKAAIAAGKRAAEMVHGTHQGTKSILLKARPAEEIIPKMIVHRENVGGDIALAEGYRPKGESRMPVLVSHWKPKEEPKAADTPIEKAPEPPVVEDLKEESPEPVVKEAPVEEAPEPEVKAEAKVEAEPETVEAPVVEEPAPVEAPAEEAAKEEAPAPEVTEKAESEEAPKKKTTGTRRSSRSKRKKTPDKE